jgi:hypothetical protein
MQLIFLADVALNDGWVAFMKIREYFKQFFVWLVDASDEIRQLIFFEVFVESPETVFHELANFDGIMIFMVAVDGETDGADQSSVFAVGIDAHESGVLPVWVAVIGFDEVSEAFGEELHVGFYGHCANK